MIKDQQINGDKILFIGHSFDDKGGISSLEKQYRKIITPYNHIEVYKTGSYLQRLFIFFKGFGSTIKTLHRNKQISIVHIHTASGVDFFRNCILIFLPLLHKKKIILHVHGGYFPEFCSKHNKITQFIINRIDCLVVVSDYLFNKLSQFNFKCTIKRIYNIIEQPLEDSKSTIGFHTPCVLGFMGAINHNKRIFDIVRLFGTHRDLASLYCLKIAGVGEIVALDKLIKESKTEDCIEYVGWVDGIKKIKFLKNIDFLLQPSDFESFGISIVEAMSYGIPAIATNVGGIPEVVRHRVDGFLFERGDFDSLYKLLLSIAENKHDIEVMRSNAKVSASRFYPTSIKSDLESLYNMLLEK